jgi:uncharacterized protein (TIGR02444 family)
MTRSEPDDAAGGAPPFWRLSLAFYGQPGVPALLLPLQDEHGADVNLVLFGLWRAAQGRALSQQEFAALDETIADWRTNIVRPARALRREIKARQDGSAGTAALYEQAKRLELQGEHIQQDRMFAVGDAVASGTGIAGVQDAAESALAAYADFLGETFSEEARTKLAEALAELARRAGNERS